MSQSNAFVNGLNWRKPFHPNLRQPDGTLKLEFFFDGLDFLDDPDFAPTTAELNDYGKNKFAGISEMDFNSYAREFRNRIYQKNFDQLLEKFSGLPKSLPGLDNNTLDLWTNDSPFGNSIFQVQIPLNLEEPLTDARFPNKRGMYSSTPYKKVKLFASPDYETLYRNLGNADFVQEYSTEVIVKEWNTPQVKAINTDLIFDSYVHTDGSRIVVGTDTNTGKAIVIKYNASGNKPYYFNFNVSKLNAYGEIRRILPVDGGNKFLLFGRMEITGNNGSLVHYAISINSDGTLDTTVEPITYNSLVAMGYDLDNMYNTYIGGDGLKIIDVVEQGGEFVVAFNYSLR